VNRDPENFGLQTVYNGWVDRRIVTVRGGWSLKTAIIEIGSDEASLDAISMKCAPFCDLL
jgi:hypothetical protein